MSTLEPKGDRHTHATCQTPTAVTTASEDTLIKIKGSNSRPSLILVPKDVLKKGMCFRTRYSGNFGGQRKESMRSPRIVHSKHQAKHSLVHVTNFCAAKFNNAAFSAKLLDGLLRWLHATHDC